MTFVGVSRVRVDALRYPLGNLAFGIVAKFAVTREKSSFFVKLAA